MDKKRAYIMLIASLCLIGTIGIVRRYIPLSSELLAFFRASIGAVTLLLFVLLFRRERQKLPGRKAFAGLILNGVFLGLNWILLFEAFNHTTIAKATLCYYMQPTIILLVSPLVFREKLTVKKSVCAVLSLTGMVFVSGVIGGRSAGAANDAKGILFGLGAAVFYSLVVILNKKIKEGTTYQRTLIQLFSAAGSLLPYLLLTGAFRTVQLNVKLILLLLLTGVVYTGVFYAFYFGSIRILKAQTVSMLSYLDPIVAMIVSAAVFRENMTVLGLIGAVLIIGSAAVSEIPLPQKKQPENITKEKSIQ